VHDRVEDARLERGMACAGRHSGGTAGQLLAGGPGHRRHPALDWDVGQHRLAAGAGGEVEARPAAPGAEIEQPHATSQLEHAGVRVGLGAAGVPVGAPVAADDRPLDLPGRAGFGCPVTFSETPGDLSLAAPGHQPALRASRRRQVWLPCDFGAGWRCEPPGRQTGGLGAHPEEACDRRSR